MKLEEVAAARVVDSRHAEAEQARGSMKETEQQLRHAQRDGMHIDLLQHHLLSGYLRHQRGVLHERELALNRAHALHERVRSNLDGIARGIKSLEKHRTGREAEHRLEQSSREQKGVDELWLFRWPHRPKVE